LEDRGQRPNSSVIVDFRNRALITAVFRHECAHLIVARSLGFVTGEITLSADRGGSGVDALPSVSSFDEIARFLEARIKVLYAGAIAQALEKRKGPETKRLLQTTASDDFSKIRELMRLLVGMKHPNASREQLQRALDKTVEVLSDQSAKIVIANVDLIVDMAVFCMGKLDEATAANGGIPPTQLTVAATDIDDFLRDKTIS
jgi:hypothetical protein